MWLLSRRTALFLLSSWSIAIFAIIWLPEDHPEVGKNIHELIESRGFSHESHFIESQNGYVLQAVRIINPTVRDRASLKPVLLHHGYQCSGTAFIIADNGTLFPNGTYWEDSVHRADPSAVGNTLGFVLATSGYDVWLLNARGNIYSANHTKYQFEDQEFWNFSLDEMIKYDLPAIVDYVRAVTKRETVAWIGHRTTMMYGLLATQPRFNQLIKPFIALSPVGFFTKMVAGAYMVPYQKEILWLRPKYFGFNTFRKLGLTRYCCNRLLRDTVCFWFIWRTGTQWHNVDPERLPAYLDNGMLGSSTRNLLQLLQQKNGLRYFDFGSVERNRAVYGSAEPPFYDFGKITSPYLVEFHVKHDRYLHLDNLKLLKDAIKVKFAYEYEVPDETFGHLELIWGKKVGKLVNAKILEILAKYS